MGHGDNDAGPSERCRDLEQLDDGIQRLVISWRASLWLVLLSYIVTRIIVAGVTMRAATDTSVTMIMAFVALS